ncbi:MAG: DUF4159 domain-containing protein [candidate division Zixibacteria bacterium]|nr:DUF4159 domain-containing protein [candidate division Zixibacteria bacterium]
MPRIYLLAILLALFIANPIGAQERRGMLPPQLRVPQPPPPPPSINPSAVTVARLHYSGGGDWYWGGSSIPNFLKFLRENSNFPIDPEEKTIQIMDDNLFRYPFLFATGHGIMKFTDDEKVRLRTYLAGGGFLFINDSYGMEKNLKKELAALFPERPLVELPFDHPIYHSYYDFSTGPPKIHEHDNKPPQGFGITIDGRVVLYYLYESDIGDGWEDPQVHNDPPEKREAALKMGMNILVYALTH